KTSSATCPGVLTIATQSGNEFSGSFDIQSGQGCDAQHATVAGRVQDDGSVSFTADTPGGGSNIWEDAAERTHCRLVSGSPLDGGRHRLVIELPAVDVPVATHGEVMVGPPLCQVLVPVSASLHSARVEVLDRSGHELPRVMLHHFNLSDPEHRELFLPIGLHLLAASKDTPAITVPRLLFGLPLVRGQRLIAGAMLANTTGHAYH